VTEPREIAKGTGWSVHRLGRSFCVTIERTDDEGPVQVWLRRSSDVVRSSLLASLVAGAHGKVDREAAIEAMGANWR